MKVASRPPLRRMCLYYQEIAADRYPNARQLAALSEVSRRTVQRDLEFAQESCSWPLGFDRGRNGYHFTQPNFAFPPLRMTEGEVVALFLAERLMEQYRGTPYEHDLRSLFQKVTKWLPEPIAVDVAGLAGSLSVVPAAVTPHDLKRFQLLAAAALHGRQLEIEYWTASRNATGRRRVDPYRLMLADGNWYLVGYCHRRQKVLTFGVVRVRQASETGETFTRPDSFDLAEYLKGSFRVWRGRGNHAVTLRFRAAVAGRVAEKHWHASQALEPQADRSLIVRFQVTDLREVQGWVLSWGSDCEVLEPAEFRTAMAAELERMLGQYAG